MKILHVTHSGAPIGGVEAYVRNVIDLLAAHGHDNLVVCEVAPAVGQEASKAQIFEAPLSTDTAQAERIIQEVIRLHRPDAAYLHTLYNPGLISYLSSQVRCLAYIHAPYPVCPAHIKFFRRDNAICTRPFGPGCIPMIYLRRCSEARHPLTVAKLMRTTRAYQQAYQKLPKIAVGSRYARQLLLDNGFADQRIHILPPHFDHPRSFTSPNPSASNILFAGRLEIEKGLGFLLRAIQRLPGRVQLQVAGDGTQRANFQALAEKLGIAARINFLGSLDANQIGEAYQNASVVVMPSIWPEMFGKVGIEALAFGRPVVAFDTGGISDWLQPGWNGYLARPGDAGDLAEKIDALLSDPSLAQQMGKNGQQLVKTHYSPEQHLKTLIELFQ